MGLVPAETFYIITRLTPEQVQLKLNKLIEIGSNQFNGYVFDGIFKFEHITNNKSPFNPEVEGLVEKWEDGSRITIRMHMRKTVAIFLMVWMLLMLLLALIPLFDLFGGKFDLRGTPWILLFLAYVYYISGYKGENKTIKTTLTSAFEAEV